MKSHRIEHVDIVDADGEYTVAFEAQFAAYLAELEADIDHPTHGTEYRELLAMDREELRALLGITTHMSNADPPPQMTLFAAFAVLANLLIAVLIIWWLL